MWASELRLGKKFGRGKGRQCAVCTRKRGPYVTSPLFFIDLALRTVLCNVLCKLLCESCVAVVQRSIAAVQTRKTPALCCVYTKTRSLRNKSMFFSYLYPKMVLSSVLSKHLSSSCRSARRAPS